MKCFTYKSEYGVHGHHTCTSCVKEKLAWATVKWHWVISNIMLFKIVIPLRTKEWSRFKFNTILHALLCGP